MAAPYLNAKARITIKGTPEVFSNLKKNIDIASNAGIDAVNNGLVTLEKAMKKDCPVNTDPEDTDTIHLKESIYIQPAKRYKKKIVGRTGPSKKTAMQVEFGTKKMLPRMFMRQQLILHKDEIRKAARDIIKGVLGL